MDAAEEGQPAGAFDPSHPLKGVVVCCTSIPANETKDIEMKTINLGGTYMKDLTVDVTHLLVGDYETAKYRHVAKAQPHTRAMDAGWIEALTELWRADSPIDFEALEKEWQLLPLEISGVPAPTPDNPEPTRGRLKVCLTGFPDPEERSNLQERITASGGEYSGELTRNCTTHLIAAKPEGAKYLAARRWGSLKVVSIEWLNQSVERGMILDEQCFDPLLPREERGKGARDDPEVARGKRQRLLDSFTEPDGPKRKLRKTASMKLSSQRENVWGDILAKKASTSGTTEIPPQDDGPALNTSADSDIPPLAPSAPKDEGIFATSSFYVQDFEPRKHDRVTQTVLGLGGHICQTPEELYLSRTPHDPWHRFIVVPQESHATPVPPPPNAPYTAETVTNFFIERCLLYKRLHDPRDHVLGRPFPVHPIRGFEGLEVNSAGFTGIDLLHMELTVKQLGAQYAETFRRTVSVLVCKELRLVRKEKLRLARDNDIPIVGEAWLWDSITAGERLGLEKYMFPELKQRVPKSLARPSSPGNTVKVRRGFELDESAFTADLSGGSKAKGTTSTGFHTARTHIFDTLDDFSSSRYKPLKEVASNAAPRPESPTPKPTADDELPPTARQADDAMSTEPRKEENYARRNEKDDSRRTEDEAQNKEDDTQRKTREEVKRREEASRKERELLAFSTKLTSLTDGSESLDGGVRKRKRGILGRATSNVSAPGSFERRSVAGEEERRSVPREWDEEDGGVQEEGGSLLTQVGYFDPGAAEAREVVSRGLEERRVKTR